MKTRFFWWTISLLLIVFGAMVGGIWANFTYRPNPTWGDLRALAVIMGAAFGAFIAALVTGMSFLTVRACNAARKAAFDYSQLPHEVAKRTSREWFVLRPALLVLSPIIAVVLLGTVNRVVGRWQIARHSNPYANHWRSPGSTANPVANIAANARPTPLASRAPSSVPEDEVAGTQTAAPVKIASRVTVGEAQRAWGDLWYANATLLQPNQTSPRADVPFALLMLMSSDNFENIVKHYRARLPVANEQEHTILFRGTRGDGRATFVAVRRYPNEPLVYITLSVI